ncbi:MAG: hypothetical protein ACI4SV_06865 [Duodenibacillus sp.]
MSRTAELPRQTLYERAGGAQAVERLVDRHIDLIFHCDACRALRVLYTRDTAYYRTRMVEYVSGFLGGPVVYAEKHGPVQLHAYHRNMVITPELRDLWFGCLAQALTLEIPDESVRRELASVFWSMADSLTNA